jgi:Ca2+-binding RTX toxin-like protein
MKKAGITVLAAACVLVLATAASAHHVGDNSFNLCENPTIPNTGMQGETVIGTPGDDVFRAGHGGPVTFYGEGGNDHFCGNKGNDKFFGGPGMDAAKAGHGSDTIVGGGGFDFAGGGVSGGDRCDAEQELLCEREVTR